MKEFDIEKLERKNIYTIPDNLFENIQQNVMNDLQAKKKVPIFKLNWGYAAAASLALIFGATFVYNLNSDSAKDQTDSQTSYAVNNQKTKTESEIAYETLKSDLTSVENNNQTSESQNNKKPIYVQDNQADKTTADMKTQTVKPASKKTEAQMNEYLDSFTNSEISELASNSTQDVYLDLYN
ncbi:MULTISPECIES: hypothetical protein [Chryseobacterium]|uniref:Uncharacterized protein (UPF0333 family) n=1 Tax=Chryseobacterium geocarposphaerae TaxID=1416776 RepID=A0ABU1LE96_9FLAO|nr:MULTISPECIES: hypothetical protein [Chryseobacterium]MDR6405043.1 uncharacterized protein (UPF0333 family) [Chryseobacterium geocarposphaerae]MDR6697826.1 uncharacterized protein (UPF0333 family) [Chryseobacterium ginsenosidimutans]